MAVRPHTKDTDTLAGQTESETVCKNSRLGLTVLFSANNKQA